MNALKTPRIRLIAMLGYLFVVALILVESASLAFAAANDDRSKDPSDTIWTDRPVRVDRQKQTFERIDTPKPKPKTTTFLDLRSRIMTLDSASFTVAGKHYTLTGVIPVPVKKLCHGDNGKISGCGQQARIYLLRILNNRTLECNEDFRMVHLHYITCTLSGKDLAMTLVEKGAGWAASPAYEKAQGAAVVAKRGIWTDSGCRRLQRCTLDRTGR